MISFSEIWKKTNLNLRILCGYSLLLAFSFLIFGCAEKNPYAKQLKKQGYTLSTESFFEACNAGNLAAVELFQKGGMDFEMVDDLTGKNALHFGVESAEIELVRFLLDEGLSIDSQDLKGNTALMIASKTGLDEIVTELIKRGSSLQLVDQRGNSSLHFAVAERDPMMVQILIEAGADKHLANHNDESPFSIVEGRANIGLLRIFQKPIVDKVFSFAFESEAGNLPLATSNLPADSWGDYSAASAFDDDLGTAWTEGASDYGVGQRIVFKVPKKSRYINILPGYGDEELFFINSSVREARLQIYYSDFSRKESWEKSVSIMKEVASRLLQFDNKMQFHSFLLPALPDRTSLYQGDIIAELIIDGVYEGRDPDTCIAEINFSQNEYITSDSPSGYKIIYYGDMYPTTYSFFPDGSAIAVTPGAPTSSGSWRFNSPNIEIHWSELKYRGTHEGEPDRIESVAIDGTLNWHEIIENHEGYEISLIEE